MVKYIFLEQSVKRCAKYLSTRMPHPIEKEEIDGTKAVQVLMHEICNNSEEITLQQALQTINIGLQGLGTAGAQI